MLVTTLLAKSIWLGRLDSNQRSRDQNPMPYRLATPQKLTESSLQVRLLSAHFYNCNSFLTQIVMILKKTIFNVFYSMKFGMYFSRLYIKSKKSGKKNPALGGIYNNKITE